MHDQLAAAVHRGGYLWTQGVDDVRAHLVGGRQECSSDRGWFPARKEPDEATLALPVGLDQGRQEPLSA